MSDTKNFSSISVLCLPVIVLLLAYGWAATLYAEAQPREGERIVSVEVSGTRTIATETILARTKTKPGSFYMESVVGEDIRRIFALGYFVDVRAEFEEIAEGLQLVFVVQEKSSVKAIEVEGNRVLRKDKLVDLFGVSPGELYNPRKVKEGIDKVHAEYARKGFSEAEVLSSVSMDEEEKGATIHLLVDEGPRMRVKQVLVEGNEAFSDRRIQKLIKTKRKRWLIFPATFNAKVLEEDVERVKAFYRKNGYQNVDVMDQIYRDPSGRGLYVHLTVTEGLQHRVGQVAIAGTVLFPEREIRRLISLKSGAVYNPEILQDDLRLIKEYYGDRGYINAKITPDPQLNVATKRVNLTYHIVENELVYINRIDVQGNFRTKDVIVRRELRMYPGGRFDGERIRKSIQRLYNLGFFEEVNVDTQPTDDPAREDLIVQVKEAKTGSFSFGGGFSSVERLIGMVELEQRNFDLRGYPHFTGAGQDLRLRVEAGSVRRYFDISFTEPWIFGHPLSFGVDVFSRTRLRSRNLGLGFEEERRGGGVRFGKEFKDFITAGLDYKYFRTDISDILANASADLLAEEGRSDTSVVGLSVSADMRDNRFDPTKGLFMYSSGDLAGIGGDEKFLRLQGGMSHYWPHGKRFVFESRIRAGVVNAYSDVDEVPIFERFFAGGSNTIRGFRERRVGPRDTNTNDPIGGESMFIGTLEEVMTIVKDERGRPILRGSVFFDIGDVWRRVHEFGESLKSGTGVGFRVLTPIGPVRLDIGFPISTVEDEKRKARFHFNVSRSF